LARGVLAAMPVAAVGRSGPGLAPCRVPTAREVGASASVPWAAAAASAPSAPTASPQGARVAAKLAVAGAASLLLRSSTRRPRRLLETLRRRGTFVCASKQESDSGAESTPPPKAGGEPDGETVAKQAPKPAAEPAEPAGESSSERTAGMSTSAKKAREDLATAPEPPGGYKNLTDGQKNAVSSFFFPDTDELDMDKAMPLEDHVREFREGALRAGIAVVICVSICLNWYKELTLLLEAPAQAGGMLVKFVQLAPGEFFFVSLKAAVAVGLLIAFPYVLFEAAVYFTPALTRSERNVVGPTVLASAVLFYAGALFAQNVLAPAALGFFLSYSQDVIESQFSIDQYFDFILSMGFATGLAFQVPVLQVALGLIGAINSEQLLAAWRYVVVASAVVGAILTPSTDPVTQLLLSGALCALYFAGAGALVALGR